MTYKAIPAASHNWSHSFVGLMNMMDGGTVFVFHSFKDWLRKNRENIIIDWIPEQEPQNAAKFNKEMHRGIENYRSNINDFMIRQGVEIEAIAELRTEFICGKTGFEVFACVKDDRGKTHRQKVELYREAAGKWKND